VPEDAPNRRLAAIVCLDVVGYSRLMGRDEEGTLARLKAIRRELIDPKLREHRGRVVKNTGDGILAEFSSSVAAVRFAVETQAELAKREASRNEGERIALRIGINLGDVLLDQGDVFGDGVNVAARLEQLAAPGTTCVSRAVFDQVRDRLSLESEFLGDQQVKNIARPVKAYRIAAGPDYAPAVARRVRLPPIALGGAALTILIALSGFLYLAIAPGAAPERAASTQTERAAPETTRKAPPFSVAVLPFANLGGDPDQDYLADGITEDLITDLSRISGSFIIARNTSFTYKGRAIDVRQVGAELGVRYVLEGSIRHANTAVRVNAQLIDSDTGAHVWSERFDRGKQDLFSLQDEVTGRIARALNLELLEAESRRLKLGAPSSDDAQDLALRGWVELLNKPQTPETNEAARALVDRAIAIDPGSALGWTALTYLHTRAASFGWGGSRAESRRLAVAAGEQAVSLDPRSSDAWDMLGYALRTDGQFERSIPAMERAIGLNPNNPLPYHGLAYGKILLGRAEEAPALLERALRLSPREPLTAIWYWTSAFARLLLGDDAGAIDDARKAIVANPRFPSSYSVLVAGYAHLGRIEEARQALVDLRRHDRDAHSLAALVEERRRLSANAVYRRQLERLREGLKLAGLPE
jgi:pentatricopeptide repeat protein